MTGALGEAPALSLQPATGRLLSRWAPGTDGEKSAVGQRLIAGLRGAMELRVGNRYRLGRKIGSGSFGDIYLGKKQNGEGKK